MQRSHRRSYDEPGHAHELTFSVHQRRPFLQSERVCRWLLDSMQTAREKWDFAVWAYVFMPEHVHLIVWPRQKAYKISRILTSIKEPVGRQAISHLREHARTGSKS